MAHHHEACSLILPPSVSLVALWQLPTSGRRFARLWTCVSRPTDGVHADEMLVVCRRYLLGLAYPAYVTVNAIESPGTQDDTQAGF